LLGDFVRAFEASKEYPENELESIYVFYRMGVMTPEEFFPSFLKKNVFIICSDKDHPNSALFLRKEKRSSRLAFFSSESKAKFFLSSIRNIVMFTNFHLGIYLRPCR